MSAPQRLSFSDAVRAWHAALDAAGFPPRLASERVPLHDALRRVPAATLRTREPCPTYRASAMDGYAIRSIDVAGATSGRPARLELGRDALAVDTGAAVADGFDAVVPLEAAGREGDAILVSAPVAAGKHVRLPGDDVPPGVVVGWPGQPLRALDCAALAASGVAVADVVKQPKLTIIPTGDELVPVGAPVQAGTVRDSNSLMVQHEATELGALVRVWPICGDDGSVRQALREAVDDADVVVLIGGSSEGRRDRGAEAIASVGTVDVRGAATRPARPVILGHAGDVAIVGLPGYPVSCHVAFALYVAPMLRALGGMEGPAERSARLADGVETDGTVDEWHGATLLARPGSPRSVVVPQEHIGGGLLRLVQADARFHLRKGIASFGRHARVPWSPLGVPDRIAQPLFVGPYDPLLEELAAIAGFRCRFTADERGGALDDGVADAVGVVFRDDDAAALRRLAGPGRSMLVLGVRREGTAYRGAQPPRSAVQRSSRDPWAAVAAVAAGSSDAVHTTEYLARRFGVRFQTGRTATYAAIWEERPGRRFPWGVALAAGLSALEPAKEAFGWIGDGSRAPVNA